MISRLAVRTFRFSVLLPFLFAFESTQAMSEELRTVFSTKTGDVSLVVSFDTGRRDWALWVAERTEAFVRAMEIMTQSPFRSPKAIRVEGMAEVWFDTPSGGKKRIGGANDGYIVRVEYDYAKIGDPRLLYHELAHYWFGYTFDKDPGDTFWLIEGIASISADAMAESGLLSMAESERVSAMNAWGGPDYDLLPWDYPLERDRRYVPAIPGEPENAGLSIFYDKSFKAVYYLIKLAGLPAFRNFCSRALAERTFAGGSKSVFALLADVAPRVDWKKALSGWVLDGPYHGPTPADFSDADSDGILGIDEILSKSHPRVADTDGDLLPDGYEKAGGSNPLVPEKPEIAAAAVRKDGPWADGDPGEWSLLPAIIKRKNAGADAKSGFAEIRLTLKDGFLFASMKYPGVMPRSDATFVDLLVDTDGDGNPDREFAAVTSRPDIPWIYLADEKKSIGGGVDIGFGDAVEWKASLDGLPDVFRILPIIRNSKLNANIVDWGNWITIDRKIAAGYRAYGLSGAPDTDDGDGDGIPDGDEILLGLDPRKTDTRATISDYGPFADGNPIDWKAFKGSEAEDKSGDAIGYDITSFKWMVKGGKLHAFARLAVAPILSENVMFDILVDRDGDGNHEIEFAFAINNPGNAWYYEPGTKKSTVTHLVRGGAQSGFEISIPLDLIRLTSGTRIYPLVYDTKRGKQIDALDSGWVSLSP